MSRLHVDAETVSCAATTEDASLFADVGAVGCVVNADSLCC